MEFSSGTNEKGNVHYSLLCVARVGHHCIRSLCLNNKLKGQQLFNYSLRLRIKNPYIATLILNAIDINKTEVSQTFNLH